MTAIEKSLELKDLVKPFRGQGWSADVYLTANGTYVSIVKVAGCEPSVTEEKDTVDDAAGAGFQIVLEDLGV